MTVLPKQGPFLIRLVLPSILGRQRFNKLHYFCLERYYKDRSYNVHILNSTMGALDGHMYLCGEETANACKQSLATP